MQPPTYMCISKEKLKATMRAGGGSTNTHGRWTHGRKGMRRGTAMRKKRTRGRLQYRSGGRYPGAASHVMALGRRPRRGCWGRREMGEREETVVVTGESVRKRGSGRGRNGWGRGRRWRVHCRRSGRRSLVEDLHSRPEVLGTYSGGGRDNRAWPPVCDIPGRQVLLQKEKHLASIRQTA